MQTHLAPQLDTAGYTLYYALDNASLIVRMALEELGQPFEAILVDRSQNAQHSSAYRALNPQGQIPVLLCPEQDEPLFETAACLLYLAQRHQGVASPLWPFTAGGQGRALKWLFYLSNTLHADLKAVFYSERYLERPSPEANENLRRGLQSRVRTHLRLLEAQLAKTAQQIVDVDEDGDRARDAGAGQKPLFPYLLGLNAYSVCDIYLAVCVRWALLYPVGNAIEATSLSELPHLHTLLKNLEQRPALIKATADEGLIDAAHGVGKGNTFFSAPRLPVNIAAATG